MEELVRTVLYGVLPSLAVALLLVGVFGPRCLGLAMGLGMLAAFGLLRGRLPAWPHVLWAGNNDGNAWLVWCIVAVGFASACAGRRRLDALGPLLAFVALATTVWLMLTTRRRVLDTETAALVHGLGLVALLVVWLATRRTVEQRGGSRLAFWLAAFLAGDAAVLLLGGSAFQGQLAGAAAVALGAGACTSLWRTPFGLDRAQALPFAVAHVGLLLAGVQMSELGVGPALAAGAAPVALAVAGPRGGARGAVRGYGALLAAVLLAGLAVWLAFRSQP